MTHSTANSQMAAVDTTRATSVMMPASLGPVAFAPDETPVATLGGGLSNVATVLFDLTEATGLDPENLAQLASGFSSTAVRRLGYLLELV
jgi:hypothetical protein